jgi:hypothetical protein
MAKNSMKPQSMTVLTVSSGRGESVTNPDAAISANTKNISRTNRSGRPIPLLPNPTQHPSLIIPAWPRIIARRTLCHHSTAALPGSAGTSSGVKSARYVGNERYLKCAVFDRSAQGLWDHPYLMQDAEEPTYPRAEVDGFVFGMTVSYDDCGDAWIQAPDGGVAGLVWETGSPAYFTELTPPEPNGRWGTYAVQLDLPLTTDSEAGNYLRVLLPQLIPRWQAWQATRTAASDQ